MVSRNEENVGNPTSTGPVKYDSVGKCCDIKQERSSWARTASLRSSTTYTTSNNNSSSTVSMKGADEDYVNKTQLIPIDCSFGTVTENKQDQIVFSAMLRKERKRLTTKRDSGVMVVFAIRRPGCASCRLNGRILTNVLAEENIGCIGIIKETNVDNKALVDLYSNYFRHPIYKDEKWRIYDAMGNRRIPVWKFLALYPKLTTLYKKEKVENVPFGGDLFTQGGILVFDKDGNLRYTYYEKYGEYFDPEHIKKVIEDAKQPLTSGCDFSISESD
jgi:AhpC/TSA antioxidant enzyme